MFPKARNIIRYSVRFAHELTRIRHFINNGVARQTVVVVSSVLFGDCRRESTMSVWPKIVIFGDSLTQRGFQDSGWCAIIADNLQRKGDVLNRGFSGYNTEYAVKVLQKVFVPISLQASDVVVIFFGANDAAVRELNDVQHVEINQYSTNLRKIANYILGLGISSENLLIVSPAPVDEEAWQAFLVSEGEGTVTDRRNQITRNYAEACGKIATELSCPYVNLWERFMEEDDYKMYLSDGLHLTQRGNKRTAELILPKITSMTESWPVILPDWKDFDL